MTKNVRYYVDTILIKAPETIRKYIEQLKCFLNWLKVPLKKVTKSCVDAYVLYLMNHFFAIG